MPLKVSRINRLEAFEMWLYCRMLQLSWITKPRRAYNNKIQKSWYLEHILHNNHFVAYFN